ncbi:MAG: hypothetical protein JST86_14610 [Bacteroidetes bacterium]|nr:hypothetical protein [Bacteroidota bacterium]
MRIQHRYLTFDRNEKLVKLLDKLAIAYKVTEKSYDATTHLYILEFHFFEDNPRFFELKQAVDKFKIEPQIGTIYDKTDYNNGEWFIVNAGEYQYPQPDDDSGYLKATFNLEHYCHLCDIGKVQNAPYRLKTLPKQPNNQFWGLHWAFDAIFVRQETKNILEREGVKNIHFSNPVLHKTNNPIEGFYQLHIDTILKKGFDNYNAKTITCKLNNEENLNTDRSLKCCGRIKFHHPQIGGYLFEKSIFDGDSDIVQSVEYFGSSGSANRLQIVSKKLKDLIEIYKLKGLSFTPVVYKRLER